MCEAKTSEMAKRSGLNPRLVLSVVSALGGMFFFGYNTSNLVLRIADVRTDVKASYFDRYGVELDDDQIATITYTIVALFPIGGVLGACVSGYIADGLGRKGGLLATSATGVVASIILGLAHEAKRHELLFAGRVLVGACSGVFTTLSPMYIAEVAPLRLRGALGVCSQLSVTLGLMTAQLLASTDFGLRRWDVMLLAAMLPCLVLVALLPLCPESPRHLLLTANKEDAAVDALSRLRGQHPDRVGAEMQDVKDEEEGAEPRAGLFSVLCRSSLRKPLFIASVLQLSQQFSGINVVLLFSTDVFIKVGLAPYDARITTVSLSGLMVLTTLMSVPFVDYVGRKALMQTGLFGMFLCSLAITGLLAVTQYQDMRALATVAVLAFVVLFAVGPGSVPWLISPEFFTQGTRAHGVAVIGVVNWAANLTVTAVLPIMQRQLGYLIFAPFSGLLLLFAVFTTFFVPETKQRTFRETADALR